MDGGTGVVVVAWLVITEKRFNTRFNKECMAGWQVLTPNDTFIVNVTVFDS